MNNLLENKNVLKRGHFVLASGKHSDIYFEKRAISRDKSLLKETSEQLAAQIDKKISVIVSPEKGAIPFGKKVSGILKVKYVTALKDGAGGFVVKDKDIENISGKNIAVVEDVLTTGESTAKVVKIIKKHNGNVIQTIGILDRSSGKAESLIGTPLKTLLSLRARSWEPKNCILCKKRVKISTKVGHGASRPS